MDHSFLNLTRYPIDRPESDAFGTLVANCQLQLASEGMFNLPGFMTDAAIAATLEQARPMIEAHAFTHQRDHNIFFDDGVDLPADHPALRRFKTTNHTICADQIEGSPIIQLYDWKPFHTFLAAVMQKPALYPMDDRIAGANVMTYYHGDGLNWHFDRSEFTTTLLLQEPSGGGEFEYAKDLRKPGDPNLEGIRGLMNGSVKPQICAHTAGTLNMFRGVNTAHRVTPVIGDTPRITSVLTYYEAPGRQFSTEERLGFYGRDAEWGSE